MFELFEELILKQPLVLFFLVFMVVLSAFQGGRSSSKRQYRGGQKGQQWQQKGKSSASEFSDAVISADQLSLVMAADFHKRALLNKSEFRLFLAVEREIAQSGLDWRLMAQVSLGEVLGSKNTFAYRAINSKRVDLLLIDKEGSPLHAIEYQGTGHHQGNAAARDAVKREALRKAGIGYHEIAAGDHPEDLRALIAKLKRNT